MTRPKRKLAAAAADPPASTPSKRQKKEVDAAVSSSRPSPTSVTGAAPPRSTRNNDSATSNNTGKRVGGPRKATSTSMSAPALRSSRSSVNRASSTAKDTVERPRRATKKDSTSTNGTPIKKPISATKSTRGRKKLVETEIAEDETATKTKISVDVPKSKVPVHDTKAEHDRELEENIDGDGPSYWLMKAEPESRITDKGKDVKFSIDDLEAATAPEAWDGVRNAVARNNMRLMMKGDMAFFYHSNCKVPGIVGTMEIIEEHSVDKTAFDKDHPYYDQKSDPEKPKWHLVHVEFRQKFPEIIKLKELQKYAKEGGILEHLQTLKQTRLSVSKVTKKEWNFIMDLVDPEEVAAASAQHQPKMIG